MKTCGQGRGRRMTAQGGALRCAEAVKGAVKDGGSNMRYNAAYFGKAMRGHMAFIQKEGLSVKQDILDAVQGAEEILKAYCDGQDCSFVSTPLGSKVGGGF